MIIKWDVQELESIFAEGCNHVREARGRFVRCAVKIGRAE